MARTPKHYIIPDSGRLSVTLDLRSLKELRKLSIDLAMPESDLLDLAVASLLQKYRETPMDEIQSERGGMLSCPDGKRAVAAKDGRQKRKGQEGGDRLAILAARCSVHDRYEAFFTPKIFWLIYRRQIIG